MLKEASRGAFILFEGIDRCGKSTQSLMLSQFLTINMMAAELIRFPNRTSNIGRLINSYLESSTDINDEVIFYDYLIFIILFSLIIITGKQIIMVN